jgi:hypothetical protein
MQDNCGKMIEKLFNYLATIILQKYLDATRKFCYIFNVAIPPLEPRVPLAPNAGAFGFLF